MKKLKTIILDNYDSFTFNLFQHLEELGANPIVYKNDEKTLTQIAAEKPTHIVISPGPGTPNEPKDIGICEEVIQKFSGKIPILGVCLGHQMVAHVFGGRIITAPTIMHGKTSTIYVVENIVKNSRQKKPLKTALTSSRLFEKIPKKFEAMRYHSLIVDEATFPKDLKITARTSPEEGSLIMAIEHRRYALYGIQFHPESFATPQGKQILKNFIQ